MKKLLIVAAVVALSSATAFAAGGSRVPGTINSAFVQQLGAGNTGVVAQGGTSARNSALITQTGKLNASGIAQSGASTRNNAASLQLGFGNGSVIIQN